MDRQKTTLWEQIRDFALDDNTAKLTFTSRLAAENGWTLPYANRVVTEYKRFVFLAMVADHEVTPSDAVDQAWHLHLTYTRNYWDQLCAQILRRPLHHGPTKGGRTESERYHDQYDRTLQAYELWFDELPPRDIWPTAEQSTTRRVSYIRVNTDRNWIVNKQSASRQAAIAGVVALSLFSVAAIGSAETVMIVGVVVALAVGAFRLVSSTSTKTKKNRSDNHASGCGGVIAGGGCGGSGHHSGSDGCVDGVASGADGGSGCGGGDGGSGGGCGGGGCGGGGGD